MTSDKSNKAMKQQNCTDTIYLQQWQRRFEERQKLASMDPRLREDIGLTEADVASEARKPFWQA